MHHAILVRKQIKERRDEVSDILGGLAEMEAQLQDVQEEMKKLKKVKHSA